jgi:hypothetical protein
MGLSDIAEANISNLSHDPRRSHRYNDRRWLARWRPDDWNLMEMGRGAAIAGPLFRRLLMKIVRKLSVLLVLIGISFTISGCGKSVAGVYKDDSGTMTFDFKSGGKVDVTVSGSTGSCDYTLDGNKVSVKGMGSSWDFTIKDDGSLDTGSPLGVLKKK